MNWLYYLLEANLYLLAFYGFYLLFLQHETFYNTNRYYLLGTSLIAFLIPILQLGILNPSQFIDQVTFPPPIVYKGEKPANISTIKAEGIFNISNYIYTIYLFTAFCFAIKLSLRITKIITLWLKAKKQRNGKITIIELEDDVAFSFFNLLFIHPYLAKKQAVIKHEMVHIQQKHSVDILFFEMVQILCWFNPIIYFLKKDIKLLHEYIADDLSTNADMKKHEYAMFLIESSFGMSPIPLTNQFFNQSILKRRINMLNKKRTASWARLRLLLALPLTGGMLCASTMAFTKDYGYVDLLPEKSTSTNTIPKEASRIEAVQIQDTLKFKKPKKDVRFPPPKIQVRKQVIESQTHYYPMFHRDEKTGKILGSEGYIIINGKPFAEPEKFYGASNTSTVTYIEPAAAIKKYGKKATFGAIEITGEHIKLLTAPVEPPPPRKDQVKFPPPIIKSNKKKSSAYRPDTAHSNRLNKVSLTYAYPKNNHKKGQMDTSITQSQEINQKIKVAMLKEIRLAREKTDLEQKNTKP